MGKCTHVISSGLKVDQSLEDTPKICKKGLHLEENRKKENYDVRKETTQEPVKTEDINNMHPLHNLLWCLDGSLKSATMPLQVICLGRRQSWMCQIEWLKR